MKCIGCGAELTDATVAAWALMNEKDLAPALAAVGATDAELKKGPGQFHAAATCAECYKDPAHRAQLLKAHFALPSSRELYIALATAGATGQIGG